VRGVADGENCADVPAVGVAESVHRTTENAAAFGGRRRVGIGTYTTLAPLDEPKRWQLGPTILFDRPRPAPPLPRHQISPVGWPSGGDQSRAEVHRVRRCGGTFQTAARRQVLTVRGAADGENCAGVPAFGAGGNRGTPYNGKCGGVRQSAQGGNRYIYNARSAG